MDVHADRLGATACGDQHGRVLRQALQALQGTQTAQLRGYDQPARAILVAQHHDAATAQFRQGALDGGQGGGCSRKN